MRLRLLALGFAVFAGRVLITSGCSAQGARAEVETLAAVPAPAPPPLAPAASAPGPQPKLFRPDSVRLLETSPTRKMLDALEARDNATAREIGEKALSDADALERGRLLWLLARADGSAENVRARLTALRTSDHPLARWAGLRLAEGLLARTPAQAIPLAESLDQGWAGASRGRQLRALALYKNGDFAKAEPLLRDLLEPSFSSNLALPLAEILAKRRDLKGLKEALAWARKVGARAVGTDNGQRADELAKQILQRMPKAARDANALPSLEDELARGDALINARNYDGAYALFDRLAKRYRGDKTAACKADLEAGKALFFKRDRDGASRRLSPLAQRCKDPEVRAWSRYYAGSARQRVGDPRGAINEYEALLKLPGSHSIMDDAMNNLAVAYQDAGDEPAMRRTLQRLIERYPGGDMRSEARFALVLAARGDRDYREALDQIDRMLAEGTSETSEGFEGRTPYWRARTLQDLGRLTEAKAGYVALVRALPLSYYAQQALARLGELEPASVTMLLAELAEAPGQETELTFRWRSELNSPSFQTALELLRLGELNFAKQELTWMGAIGDRADREMSWLVAATLNEMNAHVDVVTMARSRLRGFRQLPPRGRARHLWRIAYPRAYNPLIEQAAKEAQVPAEFVRAIAREESSFSAGAVSSALAYGLIQLIKPTARIYAAPLGLPSDAESLKRPEINLRIGAAFMRDLWKRYAQNPALIPAAYNAGYAASDRWLMERPKLNFDEWVEHIPYRETRRYIRRVLQTYGIYSWLDTGKLPSLPNKLPSIGGTPAATPPAPTVPASATPKVETTSTAAPASAGPLSTAKIDSASQAPAPATRPAATPALGSSATGAVPSTQAAVAPPAPSAAPKIEATLGGTGVNAPPAAAPRADTAPGASPTAPAPGEPPVAAPRSNTSAAPGAPAQPPAAVPKSDMGTSPGAPTLTQPLAAVPEGDTASPSTPARTASVGASKSKASAPAPAQPLAAAPKNSGSAEPRPSVPPEAPMAAPKSDTSAAPTAPNPPPEAAPKSSAAPTDPAPMPR